MQGALSLLQILAQTPSAPEAAPGVDPKFIAFLVVAAVAAAGLGLATRGRTGAAKPAVDLDPLARLKAGLAKTRGGLRERLGRVFGRSIGEDMLHDLEDVMISADMGVETAQMIAKDLEAAYKDKKFTQPSEVLDYLKKDLKAKLGGELPKLNRAEKPPTVILVAGVNGTGKTTSVAKITRWLAKDGGKVLLAASDTFRAAAVDQLATWASRLNVEIVRGQQGADPASVAHDAIEKAIAKGFDTVIIDTAGRLHTEKNLMKELEKIARVVERKLPGAPHEVLLVLDATTGQNAIRQAQEFTAAIPVTGIMLAKLDGTAKGGIVVAIRHQLDIPVKFVGLGEQPEDLEPFDADRFVEALFS